MGIPWGFDGEHGTDVRPPHVAATKAWAKNESQPGANDGTRVTAALVNRVVGNVRALADAAGSPLTESSDEDILHAVVALIGVTAPAPHMHDARYYQKAETDALLDVKVPISAIVDNLASTNALVPLSAAQGKVLKDLIDGLGDITPVADLVEAATLTGLDRGDLVHVGDNGAGKWARYQVMAVGDGTWAGCTKVLLWTQDQAPATHGHVAGDITDTTADGRAVVTAANFAAIRALLGTAAPCATRSVLKALDPAKFTAAQLLDGGRAGAFEWRTGDFSALVTADTSEGLYMAADGVPATTGAWVRSYTGPALPSWFGAVGDGVTDDTAAVQAAIDAARVIELGDSSRVYKITAALDLSAGNKRLTSHGATLDMRSIPSGNLWGMKAQGSAGSGTAITSGATEGSYTINLASTSGFAAGDFVHITSSDNYPYGGGSYNVNKGEIRRIRSLVANTSITFTTPLLDTYTTSPVVRPIAFVENIHISGLTIQGSNTAARNERGIVLQYVKGFSISDCKLDGQDQYQIEASSCIYGTIERNFLRSAFYNGVTGTIFYAIAIVDCSQWINVAHNTGDRARHLVITAARSSGQGYYGQPYYINVHHNHFYDSMAGGAGRSFAYEQHGFGRFVSFNHNIADGCHSGLRLENPQDCSAIGNIFRNYGYAGIIVGGSGTLWRNVLIANNQISRYTGEVASGAGIRFEAVGATATNINVTGNVLSDTYNATAGSGAGISIGANTYADVGVANNIIDAGVDANTSAIALAGGAHNWNILGNRTHRYRQGVSISANDVTAKNNIFEHSVVQATGFGIYSNGARNVIQGNVCRKIASAFRADTASTNNLWANNQAVQCTNGVFSDGGTGNTGRDNDVIT